MRLISSRATVMQKRVLPVFWFGLLGIAIVTALVTMPLTEPATIIFLIAPIFMMAFGYFIMRRYLLDVVDRVFDDGDALVVRNGGREERIALDDIIKITSTEMINPGRVVLSLRRPGIFGDEIAFFAPVRMLPFTPSRVVADLRERVARAGKGPPPAPNVDGETSAR